METLGWTQIWTWSALVRDASSCSKCEINRDPQIDIIRRVNDFGVSSPKWDVFIKLLLRELCRRGGRKSQRARSGGRLQTLCSRHDREDTHMNSHRRHHVQGLLEFKLDKNTRMKKEMKIQSPASNQEAICNWYLLGQRKSVFSKGVLLGVSTTLQGRL